MVAAGRVRARGRPQTSAIHRRIRLTWAGTTLATTGVTSGWGGGGLGGGACREVCTLVARKTRAHRWVASTYAPRQERQRLRLVAPEHPNVTRRARAATSPGATHPGTRTEHGGDHGGDLKVPILPFRVALAAVQGHVHAAQPAGPSGAAPPTPPRTLARVLCLAAAACRTPPAPPLPHPPCRPSSLSCRRHPPPTPKLHCWNTPSASLLSR